MKLYDQQRLLKVTNQWGRGLPIYDDGYGPLWIHRDSGGINGVVRAQTWYDAYGICEDEFLPEATETVGELRAEYSTEFKAGRDLWDYENPERPFHSLTENEKLSALQARRSRDVPFEGEFFAHPCFQEAYGFRPSGPNARDKLGHGIYAKDLNGDFLEQLTEELIEELELKVEVSDYYEVQAWDDENHRLSEWPYSGEDYDAALKVFEDHRDMEYNTTLFRNAVVIMDFDLKTGATTTTP
jgi:hypothetical protein